MASRDPEDRALVARIAAAERWGRTVDRSAATAAARNGLLSKFEREADPDGVLSVTERRTRAESLRRAHMLRMSRLAAQKRSRVAARRS